MAPQANRWIGTTEAADRLGVVPRTIYRLIDLGQLEAVKVGRVLRIQEAELEAFLHRNRVKPGDLSHLYPEAARED